MPRPYHSPSSLALGDPEKGCEAAWAWQYIAGFRPPQLTWDDILAGKVPLRGQRAPALGGAVHEIGEAYYAGKEPKYGWGSLPGQIYKSGIPYLPIPSHCDEIMVEQSVGTEPSGVEPGPRVPPTVLTCGGTRFGGFFDLGVNAAEEIQRLLKGKAVSPYLVVDYKSTSSITKWAKPVEVLLQDPQVCLYGLNMMQRYKLKAVDCRWLYMETGDSRKAKPVDICVERSHAERVLTALAPIARRLDLITDPTQAEMNMARCDDYGGRPCHWSRGGPCKARRSLGAQIQKGIQMAVNPAVRANFEVAVSKKVEEIVGPTLAAEPITQASGGAGGSTSPGGGVIVDNAAKVVTPATPRPRRPGRPAKNLPQDVDGSPIPQVNENGDVIMPPQEPSKNVPAVASVNMLPGSSPKMEQLPLPGTQEVDIVAQMAALVEELKGAQQAYDIVLYDAKVAGQEVARIKGEIKELCNG